MAYIDPEENDVLGMTTGTEYGWMEREARIKLQYAFSLQALSTAIRRTDVELRHLTDDKSLKEMETDLLRVLTLIRSAVMMQMVYTSLQEAALTPAGIGIKDIIISGAIMGMMAVTSAGVMSELS